VELGANCQVALPDLTGEVVAVDNCCCVSVTQNPPAGTLVGLGDTMVTLTATDSMGLTDTCQATVTAVDVAPPLVLGIALQGTAVKICWPHSCSPYQLEETLNLTPPIVWTATGGTVVDDGTQFCVTVPNPSGTKFFRLRKL
jgi:hypothetical protein